MAQAGIRNHIRPTVLRTLKITMGTMERRMYEGEFESLRAIHAVSPGFVPEPYAWGKYTHEEPDTYLLLADLITWWSVGQP